MLLVVHTKALTTVVKHSISFMKDSTLTFLVENGTIAVFILLLIYHGLHALIFFVDTSS
jgi:hypothetical protein